MSAWLDDGDVALYHGSAIDVLRTLPAGSVQTCVTSPPYWGLRDYGTGSTTALVARKHGRRATGIDLSAEYLAIAARRLGQQSLFATSEGVA